jgi:DNA-binding response OmpR family regulator
VRPGGNTCVETAVATSKHLIRFGLRREDDMARVLIIDDDVTLRQALTKHLEHAGHEVRQAADGNAGVRAFERHAADVVIVDIFMPGQGGLQTIGRLRREWPGVKILAMSGTKSAGAIDVAGHATSLGADRFITKPFEATELLELIRTLLVAP